MARSFMLGMVIPFLLGLAAMTAIVIPRGGHELTWPRLLSGCAALVATQVVCGYIGGRVVGRK